MYCGYHQGYRAEDALSGHDGYYKEMDRTPPRLEPYPCPACHLFRRENYSFCLTAIHAERAWMYVFYPVGQLHGHNEP